MPKGVYLRTDKHKNFLGNHHSKVSKQRISKAKKGTLPWNTGKVWDNATKKKMSDSHKGEVFTVERIRKILHRRIPTSLEKKFQGLVSSNNLPFVFVGDGSFMIGKRNPDFIHSNGKFIVIEVYYRYFKELDGRDLIAWKIDRENYFLERGWSTLFFDETQIMNAPTILKEFV